MLSACFAMSRYENRDVSTSVDMTNKDEILTTSLHSAQDDNMDKILRLRCTPLENDILVIGITCEWFENDKRIGPSTTPKMTIIR